MKRLIMIMLLALWIAPANADTSITRWVGQYPFDMMKDRTEQKRFRSIMNAKTFKLFRTATSVASQIESKGAWIVGKGCWPRNCDTRAGFFVIEIATGRPIAVMVLDGKRQTFGARRGAIPRPLARVVNDFLRKN